MRGRVRLPAGGAPQTRLVLVCSLRKTGAVAQERGATALDAREQDRRLHRLQRQSAPLGYTVSLEPMEAAPA